MVINDLEFYCVCVPRIDCHEPLRTVLLRLVTNRGVEGWAEAMLGWRPGECSQRRAALLPCLQGRNPFDVEDLLTLDVLQPAGLRALVEMACWDIIGRSLRQPLHNLFGGRYRKQIPVAVRLPQGSPGHVAEVAHALEEQGFYVQMITSCGRLEDDVRTFEAVRASISQRTELRFDGCCQYEVESARDLCAAMEYHSPAFLLDPLRLHDFHAQAMLARQTNVPLASWRSIASAADVLRAVRCGAAQHVIVDLSTVGGIAAARRCAAVAAAGGVRALLGGPPSVGVATAAMLQLAAAEPALDGCSECAYHQLKDHLLSEGIDISDGMMSVPDGHGIGVEVDRAKLDRYQMV